jgi:hypothetical protein
VYVGSTSQDLKLRRENHLSDFRVKSKKTEWIKKEKNGGRGRNIRIVLIENCSNDDRYIRENYWITHYRNMGIKLLNITDAITTSDKQKRIAKKTILKTMENPLVKENIRLALFKRRKGVFVNGVEYKGVNEASRITGISAGLISSIAGGRKSNMYKVRYV